MKKQDYICCFTGHRHLPAESADRLLFQLNRTLDILIRSGVTVFRAGGALGFDTLAALAVLDKKASSPDIKLEMCIPCRDQASKWSQDEIATYNYVLKCADRITVLNEKYTPWCMHQRNRFMVAGSDFCVAFLTSNTGGTAYTVDYAKKQGVKVINLADILDVTD